MKVNDELNVKIEKLSNLGFGIAKVDGMVIFVENACPKDELKIKLTKISKNYANASIVEIITPSLLISETFLPSQVIDTSISLAKSPRETTISFKQ